MRTSIGFAACAVLGAGFLAGCGEASGRSAADSRPTEDEVVAALLHETEACRRRLPGGGAVFTGPVRGTGVQSVRVEGQLCLDYGFEVPVFISQGDSPASGVVPLRGEVRFVREPGGWVVAARHTDHWRNAGVVPYSPETFAP